MLVLLILVLSSIAGGTIGGVIAGEIAYKVFAWKRDKNWVRREPEKSG